MAIHLLKLALAGLGSPRGDVRVDYEASVAIGGNQKPCPYVGFTTVYTFNCYTKLLFII